MTTLELDNVYEEIVERGGPTQTLAILAFVSNQAVRDDLNKQIQRLDAGATSYLFLIRYVDLHVNLC
jgi:predicted site-specific integrase-resolvase